MFKKLIPAGVSLALLLGMNHANAALSLSNTRVIIDGQSSNSVEVINGSNSRYGVQSWVEDSAGKNPGRALVVTPEFQALGGKQKAVLRLLSFAPDKNQEQLFFLNVQEIPPKGPDTGRNQLSLAVRTKIKVLVRPVALKEARKQAEEKIEISKTSGGLRFKNPTPYYFAISKVSVGGKDYTRTALGTFAPFSTVELKVSNNNATSATLSYLDDYGAVSKTTKKIN
ncbi:molecular chaperone [Buttiauxella sp. A111]|uniref:fimbrial biogenesis chaperone n=1 Tax=Buttiauxella sp. A111 TaxID=2563088 RepID=UPI0010DFA4AB|nr:fimbria/pilus periplasmic chaperone [Buttiauxella sp. A111]GDX07870.1 fimbrial protein [Buttiauxella sp. A111]